MHIIDYLKFIGSYLITPVVSVWSSPNCKVLKWRVKTKRTLFAIKSLVSTLCNYAFSLFKYRIVRALNNSLLVGRQVKRWWKVKNGRNLNSRHDLLCCPFLATPWNSKRFFLFLFSSPNHQPYKTVSWLFIEQKIDESTSHQEAPFDAPFLNLLSSRFSLVEGGDWNICSIGFNLPNAETVTQCQIQCWYVCSWTFFRQGSLKESIQGTHPLPNHKKEGDEKKTTRRRAEHRKRPTQAKDEGNRQNQQNNQDSATSFPTPNYTKKHKTTLNPRNRILHAMKWSSVWFSPDHQREWWGILSKQCLSVI